MLSLFHSRKFVFFKSFCSWYFSLRICDMIARSLEEEMAENEDDGNRLVFSVAHDLIIGYRNMGRSHSRSRHHRSHSHRSDHRSRSHRSYSRSGHYSRDRSRDRSSRRESSRHASHRSTHYEGSHHSSTRSRTRDVSSRAADSKVINSPETAPKPAVTANPAPAPLPTVCSVSPR